MSEWLDLMLEEIARKQREAQEAEEEKKRREKRSEGLKQQPGKSDQSK